MPMCNITNAMIASISQLKESHVIAFYCQLAIDNSRRRKLFCVFQMAAQLLLFCACPDKMRARENKRQHFGRFKRDSSEISSIKKR